MILHRAERRTPLWSASGRGRKGRKQAARDVTCSARQRQSGTKKARKAGAGEIARSRQNAPKIEKHFINALSARVRML